MDTVPGDSARLWLAAGWTVVVVGGATTSAEVCRACDRAVVLLRRSRGGGVVACDLSAVLAPDIAAVDALARLRLTALRLGAPLRLRPLSPQLHGLLRIAGLESALLD
ncbi:MAG TPA: STAS domain-containing protein [Candidatus Angelobacter sp.]|nr:STAS domain-containing protein [Candidatus Angelobacter sp.]